MAHDKDESIRSIAHRLWEEDGRPDGRDLEIWLRAEKLAAGKTKPATKAKAASTGGKLTTAKKAAPAKKPATSKPAAAPAKTAPAPRKPAAKA